MQKSEKGYEQPEEAVTVILVRDDKERNVAM